MDGMNMGGMNMDMSGMMMSPGSAPIMAPSPSPAGMMDHSSMGAMNMNENDEMVMYMMMWFQATTKATLWFREWSTDSRAKYAASVIGLMLLCLLQEALVWSRLHITRSAAGNRKLIPADVETGPSLNHPDSSSVVTFARFGHPLALRLGLSVLYAINVFTSYLLMLAVMTYNIGYFLVIILGLSLGHLIFMRIEQPSTETSFDACCVSPCGGSKGQKPQSTSLQQ